MQAPARVFVVIPAYAEEARIGATLRGLPTWLAGVVVVDDCSPDATAQLVKEFARERADAASRASGPCIELVCHAQNRGVGRAIASGYQRALELGADVLVVMAGDNQMDPSDLEAVVAPVLSGDVDYVKGNRFLHAEIGRMPRHRRWGSYLLGRLTQKLSGLRLDDSQCGYTALSANAARAIDWRTTWDGYGYPNDLLILLGRRGYRLAEVPVRPIYAGERSGLRPWHLLTILGVMVRRLYLERQESQAQLLPSRAPSAVATERPRKQMASMIRAQLVAEEPADHARTGQPESVVAESAAAV